MHLNKFEITIDPRFQHLTHLTHFSNNTFPQKSKTVTLNHFLIPVIWYNFRKIQ